MEGYTNVIGSSYDFDDLDIEGRVVDEWNADEEDKHASKNEPSKNLDERTILNERVKLDNGQQADVYSVVRKKDNVWYTCVVCADTVVGLAALRQHADSGKHRAYMSRPVHPCAKFIKIDPKENLSLEPGEPVPPGLEEVIIKNALIQPKLDAYKSPLIGLEYMVEMTESTLDNTEYYYCLLCDKTGSERNMFIHFTSVFHNMKYLSMYFPTAARKLQSLPNKKMKKAFGLVVTDIIKDIEEKYGRLKPRSVTYADFYSQGRKTELLKAAYEGPHFREIDGRGLFDEKATAENVDKRNKEVIAAPPVMMKCEIIKSDENTEGSGITFNKNNRINVDKKQLRAREEDKRNSSPDVEIVNVTQKPKSPGKKRTRSRSLSSISSISSSSSRSHSRSRYRHHSKPTGHRHWTRSRSRSPGYRHRRYEKHSPSYGRRYSPGRRSRSPHSHARFYYYRSHQESRGHSPDPYRMRVDRYGRQVREKYDSRNDKYRREKTPDYGRGSPKEDRPITAEEKIRWEKFREELKKVETVKLEKLKYHEKNPEKHPQYPEEWKAFWNRRYNELQRSGVDPSKHDFKPEWIAFWTKRMKELYEEDLGKAKEELKKKFDLPEDPGMNNAMPWKYHQRKRNNTSPGLVDVSPPTPEKKDVIADIKTTWKAFTGSDIKDTPKRPMSPWEEDMPTSKRKQLSKSRSPSPPPNANDKLLEDMPQRKSRTSALIFVLRKLTVLEQQLGSLAPKVFELMSQSLALEKIKEDASLDLLLEEENSVYLETVREKVIALLCAGVVPRNFVNTARSAIKNTDIALYLASKKQRSLPLETVRAVMGGMMPPSQSYAMNHFHAVQPLPKSEPLVVPGIGQVDKVSIAQQIAAALVEQGKTNVTEVELEQLINAVVGMAEASAHSSQPMTTAYFLQRLQSMQNPTLPTAPTAIPPAPPAVPPLTQPEPAALQFNQASVQTNVGKPATAVSEPQPSAPFGALKLLQSAYNESSKAEQDSPKPDTVETVPSNSVISDTELASTLSVFNKMTKEDQPTFISRLKTTNPEMYKRLCPFIPTSVIAAADNPSHSPSPGNAKRSPINIPISKERSEQKIKPLSSGRLSPFSQRSGGVNPTIGDKVVIDDDEDDKSDVKIISETPVKQPSSKGNVDPSKYKSNESDLDDDDDDDYSYEDVYKAAQEKLRQQQKQVDDDDKSNLSVASKETTNTEAKETGKLSSDNSHQSMPASNPTWGNPVKPPVTMGENMQQNKANDDKSKSQPQNPGIPEPNFRTHQPLYPDANKYNEIPARPDAYQGQGQSSYPYQGSIPEMQPPVDPYTNPAQPPLGGSSIPTYTNKDQYSNDPYYSEGGAGYYNKNSQYPPDAPYSSTRELYGNPARDPYSSTYKESYNTPYNAQGNSTYGSQNTQGNAGYGNQTTPGNSAYGNPISTYSGNQYSYRDPSQYGGNNFSQGRYPQTPNPLTYPTPPAPPSRYPNQRYPPY